MVRPAARRSTIRATRESLVSGLALAGLGLRARGRLLLGCGFWLHALGKLLAPVVTVPLLVGLLRDLALHEELRELAALRLALEGHRRRLHPFERAQHVAKQRDLRGGIEPVPRHGQPDGIGVDAPEAHPIGEVIEDGDAELIEAPFVDDPRGLGATAISDRGEDFDGLIALARLVELSALGGHGLGRYLERKPVSV